MDGSNDEMMVIDMFEKRMDELCDGLNERIGLHDGMVVEREDWQNNLLYVSRIRLDKSMNRCDIFDWRWYGIEK